jgi:hypothetical protein
MVDSQEIVDNWEVISSRKLVDSHQNVIKVGGSASSAVEGMMVWRLRILLCQVLVLQFPMLHVLRL